MLGPLESFRSSNCPERRSGNLVRCPARRALGRERAEALQARPEPAPELERGRGPTFRPLAPRVPNCFHAGELRPRALGGEGKKSSIQSGVFPIVPMWLGNEGQEGLVAVFLLGMPGANPDFRKKAKCEQSAFAHWGLLRCWSSLAAMSHEYLAKLRPCQSRGDKTTQDFASLDWTKTVPFLWGQSSNQEGDHVSPA